MPKSQRARGTPSDPLTPETSVKHQLGRPWEAEVKAETEEGWKIKAVFTEEEGAIILRELRVYPRSRWRVPSGGLSARWLRSLGITKLLHAARENVEVTDRVGLLLPSERIELEPLRRGELLRRPGRKAWPDSHYARVAIRYCQIVQDGSPKPVEDLRAELNYSASHTRSFLHTARKKGFLTSPPSGHAGGEPTPKAYAALEEERKDKRQRS